MYELFSYIINIAIVISIMFFSYLFVAYLKEKNVSISQLLDKEDNIDITKQINKIKVYYKYEEKKEIWIIRYIKSLILRANIRNKLIRPVTILLVCFITSIISGVVFIGKMTTIQLIILSLFLFSVPIIILYFISERIGGKTNVVFIDFLNLLENFLEIKDDINFAMYNISKYNLEPLSNYCKDYVFDTKHGDTPQDALKKFSDKVDNPQFKYLIKTIINCNNNSGKYKLVVQRYKNNYLEIYEKLLERKKEAKKNRVLLIVMMVLIIIILGALSISNPQLKEQLVNTDVGNILLTMFEISLIITFYISINVGKFNFD